MSVEAEAFYQHNPLDAQRLRLLDKQTAYHQEFERNGMVEKGLAVLEERQFSDEAFSLSEGLPDRHDKTLQVVPMILGDGQPDKLCILFQWRHHVPGEEKPLLEDAVAVVAEWYPNDSYEIWSGFTPEQATRLREMLDELQDLQESGELANLGPDLSCIESIIEGDEPYNVR